jgi:glycosyltransferase involved in cell wall biosynthesis
MPFEGEEQPSSSTRNMRRSPDSEPAPLISIVTPSFNQRRFIEQTVLSLQRQTYQNFEHIIVDAGSTDGTLEVLRKHETAYAMVWSSEPDSGMYHGINKGLRKARGEILAYLNSDDLYLPWTLEVVADHFARNPSTDLLYGDVVLLHEGSMTFELTFCPQFNLNWAISIGGLYQPTVFWSRRIYQNLGGFDEALKCVGDYEYWLRVAKRGTVRKVNEFLAVDRLQHEAKRFVQKELLAEELTRVRRSYGGDDSKTLRKWLYRTYGYMSTRSYMSQFLAERARKRHTGRGDWGGLLGVPDLVLPPWYRLLLRFLPFRGNAWGAWQVGNLPANTGVGA